MAELRSVRKGARVTGGARDAMQTELRDRYLGGASIRSLADSTGRSYGFVRTLLTEAGVALRGRGGPNRRKAVPGH
ncbi:transcriptional regulator [Rhodococcus spelaei]|uniref:Transcriptional regulator n=1 Tax=Rhodococcus spelaei TaxID=2546320 RepID=A0A541B2B9_9NOCA|nr:helix-turn-helix domain-containing protein [Rhodococcus spelaei]TQF66473.1 transcriptional regulator [Rhodococcus spelaei]